MTITDLLPVLQDLHRTFHDSLVGSLQALKDAGSATALVSLVTAGFLYGVLHAIGPGHGKVVIGAYMFADDHTLRKGLAITALSSLLQAAVAIALVLILFFALGLARASVGAAESASAWMEYLSFGLLAAVGAILVARGARFLRAGRGATEGNHHGTSACHCGGCSHHAPIAQQLRKAQGLRGSAAVVASIGLRPCSGALLLMSLACLTGEIWAGIAGTLAMGVGTGISVSAVAVAAVQSRKWLLNLVSVTEARLAAATGLASIFGGVAIIMSVAVLLAAPLSPIHAHSTNKSNTHLHKR
jgi:ABC-type nickel/cobalt efflux system permease component RcnA